ncbi:MAG TPA: CorA family divalent cation transporter [Thermomicrobiales bacterium]|nr:CorA family divalent cation transporter [Thermomicrobiales bacterium]
MEIRRITSAGVEVLNAQDLAAVASATDGVTWVHLDHNDEPGMTMLVQLVDPDPDDLRDVHSRTPVPKLHMYAHHIFSAINGLARGSDGLLHFQPLKVFLTQRTLWTVFGPATTSLSASAVNYDLDILRRKVDSREVLPSTAFELITTMRSVMLRGQEELIATGGRRIADLEGRVMTRDPVMAEAVLQDLFELRHDLQTIRINAAQAYELYDNLLDTMSVDDSVMQIDTRRLALLRQQYGHLKNSADLERDYLQEVLDLFQTRVSNELNRFVRKITAFGTIAISWTVVAGVYGMNFTNMPELGWTYGYPSALGLMIALTVVLWLLFRRQHWL